VAAGQKGPCSEYPRQIAKGFGSEFAPLTAARPTFAAVKRECGYNTASIASVDNDATRGAFAIGVRTDNQPIYVWVVGWAKDMEYDVRLDPADTP